MQRGKPGSKSKRAERGGAESQLRPDSSDDPPDDVRPAKSIERHLRWKKRRESWLPIITVMLSLMALFVISIQAIIYNQQRRIMNGQRDVMDNQLRTNEKSLRISERAYVGVGSITADITHRQIVVMLENVGKVPAENISVEANAYRYHATKELVGSRKLFDAGEVRLFPGSLKMRVVVPIKSLAREEINAIRARAALLLIVGEVHYQDGFGDHGTTRFAFEYSPPPTEGWTAIGTPLDQIRPMLESKTYNLPTREEWMSELRRDLESKTFGPLRIESWPTRTTPTPTNQQSKETGTGCACSCSWICGRCEFYCTNCSLSAQIEAAKQCCEAVQKAVGDPSPCQEWPWLKP